MDPDPLEGPSSLFESMLGQEISEEQWEDYRKQRKLEGEFILDSDSDEENVCNFDSRTSSPYSFDDELVQKFEISEQDGDVEMDDVSDEDTKVNSVWSSEVAMKYVNGEISFLELPDELLGSIKPRHSPKKKKLQDENKCSTNEESQLEKEDREYQEELKGKKKKSRRRLHEVPKELEGLMGTANLCYAKGKKDEAIKYCMELIRSAPNAQAPYQLLGEIYEDEGEAKKSLQCFLVAANLNPVDTEEWIRLAEMCLEQSQVKQAIKCYSFAIRNEPSDVNILWERCNLYEQAGDRKNALEDYKLILKHLTLPEDGPKCVDISRQMAKEYHKSGDYVNAIQVLETAFSKFPSEVTSEDVNLLLELQLNEKCYRSALKTFLHHCGVVLKRQDNSEVNIAEDIDSLDEESFSNFTCCNVPNVLPIDLQVKLIVCLIHLKSLKAIQDLLAYLLQENPNEMGDLHLDVAEAFMDISEYSSAKPLFEILVSSEKYNLAGVWLKYGDCLNALSLKKEAAEAYKAAIKLTPSYEEARLSLSKILLDIGKESEAADVLKQEFEDGEENTTIDLQVLFKRCALLYEQERWDEFLDAGILAQYSHCYYIETPEEYRIVVKNQTYRRRHEVLKDLPSVVNRCKPTFVNNDYITLDEAWDLFKKVSEKLLEFHQYGKLQAISFAALTSHIFKKSNEITKDIELQALLASFYNKNYRYAYMMVKEFAFKAVDNVRVWNLFCLIVTGSQEVRHNRFCLRLMMKHQDHLALGLLNGHNAMISGSYKHALGEYMCLLKERPNDDFILFCAGITFIHMASQRFSTKRHFLALQGLAFLQKYVKLQGNSQESLYNTGRALHQLGIKDAALQFYKKALAAPVAVKGPEQATFDLRREIAFNISLIYSDSEAMNLSYMYLRKYIIV